MKLQEFKNLYHVGGSVRDTFINARWGMCRKIKDFDCVFVGYECDELIKNGFEKIDASFPVFLHPDHPEHEFVLARKEVKHGPGHRDFSIVFDKSVTLEEDLRRRDFTINAIARESGGRGGYIDPFDGISDIENRLIRIIDPVHFVEDPLRILRAFRFATTLGFNIETETSRLLCGMIQSGMLKDLTAERIWGEVVKCLEHPNFHYFIALLDSYHALHYVFPELEQMKHITEELYYHAEGTTFNHTCMCLRNSSVGFGIMDCMFEPPDDKFSGFKFKNFAMLCHDLGKIKTPAELLPKHHGHDEAGIELIEEMCERLKVPNELKKPAIMVCKNHMRFLCVSEMRIGSKYDFVDEITEHFKSPENLIFLTEAVLCDKYSRYALNSENTDLYTKFEPKVPFEFNCDKIISIYVELMEIFNFMKGVTSKDFPDLSIYSGKRFGEMLRIRKIELLRKKIRESNNTF